MKLTALWVGLALWGLCPAALAEGAASAAPAGSARLLPLSTAVTVEPQREEAQSASSNMDDVFGGGDSRNVQSWQGPSARHLLQSRMNRRWYGWRVLTSDAAFGTLLGVGLVLGSRQSTADANGLAIPGTIGCLLGAPLIHLAEGRPGISGASLALRLPVALMGAGLALGLQKCERADGGEFCLGSGLVPAFFTGLAITSGIDATLFGWANPKPERRENASFGLTPALSPDGKSGELRVFGQF